MNRERTIKDDLVKRTIESYWRTVPPLWHITRSDMHRMARDEFGITSTQFHTLRRISEGKKSVSEISDCMFISRPNVSRSVEVLVSKGWVNREGNSIDRRNINLSLTDKGSDLLKQLHARNNLFMAELFSTLDESELQTIITAFNSLGKILNKNSTSKG
jgi:DNA-binding MarR family transcriptional regulator